MIEEIISLSGEFSPSPQNAKRKHYCLIVTLNNGTVIEREDQAKPLLKSLEDRSY